MNSKKLSFYVNNWQNLSVWQKKRIINAKFKMSFVRQSWKCLIIQKYHPWMNLVIWQLFFLMRQVLQISSTTVQRHQSNWNEMQIEMDRFVHKFWSPKKKIVTKSVVYVYKHIVQYFSCLLFFFCWRKSNKFWINKLSPETKDYHRCIKSSLANKHVMLLSPDQLFTFSESYWFSFGNCATTWKTNKLLTQSNQTDGQMDWEQGCRVFLKHSLFLYTLLWLSYFFFNWPLTSFRSFHFSRISSSTPQNVSNVQRCIEVNWLLSLQFGNASNGDWKLMCW